MLITQNQHTIKAVCHFCFLLFSAQGVFLSMVSARLFYYYYCYYYYYNYYYLLTLNIKRMRIILLPVYYYYYSITSLARTRMARLPWMTRTLFLVPTKFLQYLKKTIFRDFFLFYHGIVCCMYSLESPHRGDSNEYTQHTIVV